MSPLNGRAGETISLTELILAQGDVKKRLKICIVNRGLSCERH